MIPEKDKARKYELSNVDKSTFQSPDLKLFALEFSFV